LVRRVSNILDSPELTGLIDDLDALRWTGRKGYPTRSLVGACLVKSLYAIPTWSRAADLIAEHEALQEALGGAPSVHACYRFLPSVWGVPHRPHGPTCWRVFAQ
jgi:hypothetical protein